MKTPIPHTSATLALCLLASPVSAEFFCIDSVTEFNSAIIAARNNNEADEIRVVGGNYLLGTSLFFQSEQGDAITIRGGYQPLCGQFTAAETILDGQGKVRPLVVRNTTGTVRVEGLTFVDGFSASNGGGGLWVNNTIGDIRIERNTFIGNRAEESGGALKVLANGASVTVRTNLAFGNSSPLTGGFDVVVNGGSEVYITGNTIVANATEGDFGAGGLYFGGDANFTLSNNIIWNNIPDDAGMFVSDLKSGPSPTTHSRFSNNVGVVANGTVADIVEGELSVDPQFAPCGGFLCYSFELKRGSPLVDIGTKAPLGDMSTLDLAGKPRTIGPSVDIGAYENDLIFADGFQ